MFAMYDPYIGQFMNAFNWTLCLILLGVLALGLTYLVRLIKRRRSAASQAHRYNHYNYFRAQRGKKAHTVDGRATMLRP